jgi:ABC-type branched-subunit amino acid transport system substrate-binding protein
MALASARQRVPVSLGGRELVRGRRIVAVGLALTALIAASCGTRVDRASYLRSIASSGDGYQGNELRPGVPAASTMPGAVPGTTISTGASSQGGSTHGAASPTGGSSPAGRLASRPPGPSANPYGLSTAEVGKTILVGIHLPETGAAPLPMGWQQDLDTVQEWLDANPVYGRKVQFEVEDDGYDPATGAAACNKIADSHPVIAAGWTMPEVEIECGRLFSKQKIPYLMLGLTSQAVTGCSVPICYFITISQDYEGRLAADYLMDEMNGSHQRIGMVYENDIPIPGNNFVTEVKAKGGKVLVDESNVPRQQDFSSTIVKLQQAGCTVVLLVMSPVDAITLSTQAQSQGYHPTWFGLGASWNYGMTLESAGMAMDGAISFSPWASIDSAAADQWKSVDERYNPGTTPDDIGLIVFGWGSLIRAVLQATGPDLTEASLASAMSSLSYSVPFWAPITYTPTNHLGPTSVAVFKADGQAKRWDQITGFESSF